MRCNHTGLPCNSCAHCNGVRSTEKPAFRPMVRDETPRLVKGRGKVEWQGVGQSTGNTGAENMRRAAADGSYRGPWELRSTWAMDNMMRTLVRGLEQ